MKNKNETHEKPLNPLILAAAMAEKLGPDDLLASFSSKEIDLLCNAVDSDYGMAARHVQWLHDQLKESLDEKSQEMFRGYRDAEFVQDGIRCRAFMYLGWAAAQKLIDLNGKAGGNENA
jgi:hypothetical protein